MQWDEGSQTLKGSLRVVEDFDHILFIHVPQNYNLLQIAVDGVDDIKSEADGDVLKVIFRVPWVFKIKKYHGIFHLVPKSIDFVHCFFSFSFVSMGK